MQLATSLSKRENAEIDIVHPWELPYESTFRSGRFRMAEVELKLLLTLEVDRHKARLHALLERYDMTIYDDNVHLIEGDAAESINWVAEQNDSDIIVMGTLGRVGIPELFIGNMAEEIFQTSRSSVLAVKPIGFRSAVE